MTKQYKDVNFWKGDSVPAVGDVLREGRLTVEVTHAHVLVTGTILIGQAHTPTGEPVTLQVTQPTPHPLSDLGVLSEKIGEDVSDAVAEILWSYDQL